MLQAASVEEANRLRRLGPVRAWLHVIALLVLLMVLVGGITRLTDSGLSITQWKPISGTLPPLSAADWQAEFDAYKLIPEYQIQNHWMSLEEFKSIFWWEWGHRFLGRFIGAAFLIPFLVFLWQKRLDRTLAPALGGLFVLGGLQGALGWWMVSSGLTERVDVSQYRLAAHLGAAALLFAALVYVARTMAPRPVVAPVRRNWRLWVGLFAVLVFVQIVAGALVAGLDAGMGYNTWPLMDGALVPDGLDAMSPVWVNLFENAMTVQFVHRLIAYALVVFALALLWAGRGLRFGARPHVFMALVAVLVLLQVVLGIGVLVMSVPVSLAVMHQGFAFVLFGTVVAYLADMRQIAVL
ncbi:MAG: COX15/CtaA family protein [Alphaproteobacteria bacterium]|nr:COX15/CtaA family protein [Alphaproteobacteria bacterium]